MGDDCVDNLSVIIFKNHLLSASDEELKELYNDEESFLAFLDIIAIISQNEPGFFLIFPELKDRIFDIINMHRFSCDKELVEYINLVLVYFNNLDNIPKNISEIIISSYVCFQEKLRKIKFNDNTSLALAFSYDSIFLYKLLGNDVGDLKSYDGLDMSSLNYLIQMAPELFCEKDLNESTQLFLDKEDSKTKLFSKKRKNIRNIRKFLNSLELIEE